MADDRVADVEVIRCTDEDAMWFMQSLSPDGSARVWSDARLSCERTISVSVHSPTTNKGLHLGRLMDAVRDVLVMVESQRQSPEQMRETDRWELRIDEEVHRYQGGSRYIFVLKEPHLVRGGWRRWTGIEPAGRGSPIPPALKAGEPTRRSDTSTPDATAKQETLYSVGSVEAR